MRARVITLVTVLLLFVGLIVYAAQETSISEADQSTSQYISFTRDTTIGSSSLSFSNEYDYAFRPGSFWYNLPASSTNVLSMDHVRIVSSNQYLGDVITTNVFDEVVTNWYSTVTNVATSFTTSRIWSASVISTAATTYVYDEDDFGKYIYVLPGDRLQFDFSRTNSSVPFILNALR